MKDSSQMGRGMFFFLVLLFSLSAKAEVFRHFNANVSSELSFEEKREVSSLMSCQIKENFDLYKEHILNSIIPRVDQELSVMLRPHISIEGVRVQVAEEIDSSDLFHVHVRMPTPPLRFHPIPFSAYSDPEIYHLQYHSFERSGMITKKWRQKLSEVDDPLLSGWLSDVKEHIFLQSQLQDPGFNYGENTSFQTPLEAPLTEEQKDYFSNLWYEHENENIRHSDDYKSWLLQRLKTRLNFIDPQTHAFDNLFSQSRSVISTGRDFLILDRLNLPDYNQFANIYFEERADMPEEFEEILKSLERDGLETIIRDDEEFGEALEIFRSIEDDYNVFKYAYSNKVSARKHKLITWTKNHVFSVSFSLNCLDEEDRLPPVQTGPGPF